MIAAVVTFFTTSEAMAQELPDLKVVKVEIVPNSTKDLNDAFFRGRPMLEVAPASENDVRLQLPRYRSYRFIVTIHVGQRQTPSTYLQRIEYEWHAA